MTPHTHPALTAEHVLDVTGLNCPIPVLRTRKTLGKLPSGALLKVLATDPAAHIDFRHLCNTEHHTLISDSETDGVICFIIQRKA